MGIWTNTPTRSRVLFLLGIIVTVYVVLSVAIAVSTVDECGDEDADKHWTFVPPEWVCD